MQDAFERWAARVSPSVVAISAVRLETADKLLDGLTDAELKRRLNLSRRPAPRRVLANGSGVILAADGLILTNEHVVGRAEKISVTLATGRTYRAAVVAADPRSDLAVIRVPVRGLTPLSLGEASGVRVGQWVLAVGNPYGLATDGEPAMTFGVVSAVGRCIAAARVPGDRYYGNLIQTDAAINPGNSGGPLINIRGQVIGIATAISSRTGVSEGVGFAIPVTRRTRHIIGELMAGRPVEYGYLGVLIRKPTEAESRVSGAPAGHGALVVSVEAGSPAEATGLRPGDLITHFDGGRVLDADHLVRLSGQTPVGRAIHMIYWRVGARIGARVTLARRPDVDKLAVTPSVQWRGMTVVPLTRNLAARHKLPPDTPGVFVERVARPSPAAAAGIPAGAVLLKIGPHRIDDLASFRIVAGRAIPSPAVRFRHGGRTRTVRLPATPTGR
jgi:S1-C subfamily serine protease